MIDNWMYKKMKWLQILIRFDNRSPVDRHYYEEWKKLVMLTGSTKKALIFLLKLIERKNGERVAKA